MLFFILMSIFVIGTIVSILFYTNTVEAAFGGVALLVMVFFLSLVMTKYLELSIKVVN